MSTGMRTVPGQVLSGATPRIDLTSLTFLITHWGVGLSPNMEKPPAPDGSQLGGYGLPFVRRVFDEVGFESRESNSTVRLRKCLIPGTDPLNRVRPPLRRRPPSNSCEG